MLKLCSTSPIFPDFSSPGAVYGYGGEDGSESAELALNSDDDSSMDGAEGISRTWRRALSGACLT